MLAVKIEDVASGPDVTTGVHNLPTPILLTLFFAPSHRHVYQTPLEKNFTRIGETGFATPIYLPLEFF